MHVLHAYDQRCDALTQERRTLWVMERGFVNAPFWDAKKRALKATAITRMKTNLCVDSTEGLPIVEHPCNEGVRSDLRIRLTSSREEWRLIRYRTPGGKELELLTNEFSLLPGVVAFLYGRRWEQEKTHDNWKNDFAVAKAWGKSPVAIANQAALAIITTLLVHLMLARCLQGEPARDEKALRKQDRRQRGSPIGRSARSCAQLEQLPQFLASKRSPALRYRDAFANVAEVRLLQEPPGCESNYWLQTLILDEAVADQRDAILTATNDAGLMTRPAWMLMHPLPPYQHCLRAPLPVAESLARRIINLPSSAGLA